ncbi:MAG: glycosyltransferase family 2 protein [Bacteroidales bacterium]|nr:glycosyltransferase family 2 protein [Bacteroidales bacterium]
MDNIAVVILNWNGSEFLKGFLPTVIAYSRDDARIYVADNGSTDNSMETLEKEFPEIAVIKLNKNYGFALGYNLALQQIDAKYFMLLNSDVEVTENWLKPLASFLDTNEDFVACQPKLLSYHDRNKFEYAGAAGGFIDKLGYPFCRGRMFMNIEEDKGQYDDDCEIFWASGACMFIRSEKFHEVDGFDPDFFAHMEEIDLCWRLKNKGYKIGYCHNSTIYHIGGGTLPKTSWRKTYYNIRNNEVMLYKNLPPRQIALIMPVRFVLDIISSFKFFIDGGVKDFWAVIRAHFSFYRHFRKNKNKRKNITQSNVSCSYSKPIVFKYYLQHKKLFSQLNKKDFTANS